MAISASSCIRASGTCSTELASFGITVKVAFHRRPACALHGDRASEPSPRRAENREKKRRVLRCFLRVISAGSAVEGMLPQKWNRSVCGRILVLGGGGAVRYCRRGQRH